MTEACVIPVLQGSSRGSALPALLPALAMSLPAHREKELHCLPLAHLPQLKPAAAAVGRAVCTPLQQHSASPEQKQQGREWRGGHDKQM